MYSKEIICIFSVLRINSNHQLPPTSANTNTMATSLSPLRVFSRLLYFAHCLHFFVNTALLLKLMSNTWPNLPVHWQKKFLRDVWSLLLRSLRNYCCPVHTGWTTTGREGLSSSYNGRLLQRFVLLEITEILSTWTGPLKALTDHLGRGSRVGSFDPCW